MTSHAFDSNIVIDALAGFGPARDEIRRALDQGGAWVSRMVWVEILSKGVSRDVQDTQAFLGGFNVDEIDADIALRAAALRRERRRLKSPDAIILASATRHGRILVTRNIRDFPAAMPGIRVPYLL